MCMYRRCSTTGDVMNLNGPPIRKASGMPMRPESGRWRILCRTGLEGAGGGYQTSGLLCGPLLADIWKSGRMWRLWPFPFRPAVAGCEAGSMTGRGRMGHSSCVMRECPAISAAICTEPSCSRMWKLRIVRTMRVRREESIKRGSGERAVESPGRENFRLEEELEKKAQEAVRQGADPAETSVAFCRKIRRMDTGSAGIHMGKPEYHSFMIKMPPAAAEKWGKLEDHRSDTQL